MTEVKLNESISLRESYTEMTRNTEKTFVVGCVIVATGALIASFAIHNVLTHPFDLLGAQDPIFFKVGIVCVCGGAIVMGAGALILLKQKCFRKNIHIHLYKDRTQKLSEEMLQTKRNKRITLVLLAGMTVIMAVSMAIAIKIIKKDFFLLPFKTPSFYHSQLLSNIIFYSAAPLAITAFITTYLIKRQHRQNKELENQIRLEGKQEFKNEEDSLFETQAKEENFEL